LLTLTFEPFDLGDPALANAMWSALPLSVIELWYWWHLMWPPWSHMQYHVTCGISDPDLLYTIQCYGAPMMVKFDVNIWAFLPV